MDSKVQEYYDKAGVALKAAREILSQETVTQEDSDRSDKLMADFDLWQAKGRQLEALETKSKEFEAYHHQPDPARALPVPGLTPGMAAGQSPQEDMARKAFEAFLRGGMANVPSDMKSYLQPYIGPDIETKAANNETTPSQGGYLTPTVYTNDLIKALYDVSIMRAAGARQIPLMGTSTKMATLTASAAAVLVAEANAFDEKEPTFGEVTFAPYKYTRLSKVSDELVADSRYPMWDVVLQPDFVQAFALAENAAFTNGTGSSQPQGIVTGASAGITAGSVSTVTSDELISLYYALDYKYRPRAKWMLNDLTAQPIRKLTNDIGDYMWIAGLQPGVPDTLLGQPVITNPSMPLMATGNKSVLFGDFSYFWIGDREGLQVKPLFELYAGTGQVGYRAYKRFDSHVMLSAALKVIVHP